MHAAWFDAVNLHRTVDTSLYIAAQLPASPNNSKDAAAAAAAGNSAGKLLPGAGGTNLKGALALI